MIISAFYLQRIPRTKGGRNGGWERKREGKERKRDEKRKSRKVKRKEISYLFCSNFYFFCEENKQSGDKPGSQKSKKT